MNKSCQQTVIDIVEQYKQDKNVLGIVLFGSVARGVSDKYSDVDIYILLKKEGKFKRINFVKNKLRVDVIFSTKKETKNYLDSDKRSLRRITSDMLANGIVLFDRKNDVKKIIGIAKTNLRLKTSYSRAEILMHKYSIDDFWGEVRRDIENGDSIAFGIDSQLLINNILELFLKINGSILPPPNKIKKLLFDLDSKFARKVSDFYKGCNFEKKIAILDNLIEYTYQKSGGRLPDRWVLK